LNDDDSTRFTDTQILNVIKKAIRRANRIVQRNGLQFGKKKATLTTVASQAYLLLSSVTDFDVWIGLWRDDLHQKITMASEDEWESVVSPSALDYCHLDYVNDKIEFAAAPSSAQTLTLWYYPTVDPSAYAVGTSTQWAGRIDDIIAEYTANRLKNIDEMDVSFDTKLLTDLENQILQAYAPNSPTIIDGSGWL
jgi:hypothetical protein